MTTKKTDARKFNPGPAPRALVDGGDGYYYPADDAGALDRIATALERIAAALEQNVQQQPPKATRRAK